jgi:hypothetical protein
MWHLVAAIIGMFFGLACSRAHAQLLSPNDQVNITIRRVARAVATAQEKHFVDEGEYFTGECSKLSDAQLFEGVVCTTTKSADGTSFTITVRHPKMHYKTGCTWKSNPDVGQPNLVCE